MMAVYYNEIEPAAVHTLKCLIADGVLPYGHVDSRSIVDVHPSDLIGFKQCHFFAGAGIWALAMKIAGVPLERSFWTGSAPCQPYSVAGKGLGADDPRHLWPHLYRLASARRPDVIMGEQVSGAAGRDWFDGVSTDLETAGFVPWAVDVPACSVNAPHQRNRIYWCARRIVTLGDAVGSGLEGLSGNGDIIGRSQPDRPVTAPDGADAAGDVENSAGERKWRRRYKNSGNDSQNEVEGSEHQTSGRYGSNRIGNVEHGNRTRELERVWRGEGLQSISGRRDMHTDGEGRDGDVAYSGCESWWPRPAISEDRPIGADVHGKSNPWAGAVWIKCHDKKARRAKPDLCLLAHGIPGRTHLWRLAGNAIVLELAVQAIAAFMDTEAQMFWSAA